MINQLLFLELLGLVLHILGVKWQDSVTKTAVRERTKLPIYHSSCLTAVILYSA